MFSARFVPRTVVTLMTLVRFLINGRIRLRLPIRLDVTVLLRETCPMFPRLLVTSVPVSLLIIPAMPALVGLLPGGPHPTLLLLGGPRDGATMTLLVSGLFPPPRIRTVPETVGAGAKLPPLRITILMLPVVSILSMETNVGLDRVRALPFIQ